MSTHKHDHDRPRINTTCLHILSGRLSIDCPELESALRGCQGWLLSFVRDVSNWAVLPYYEVALISG